MAHLDHSFGVELECYLPVGRSRQELAEAINARIGAGRCAAQSYNHLRSDVWKIVTDGSLGDYTRGCEVVSPVLCGLWDLETVDQVCKAMTDFGCTVNRTCGLHVHVGVGSPQMRFWQDLISLYALYEPVIDAMMPVSRRASANNYCRTLTRFSSAEIMNARTFGQLNNILGGRYTKINMEAYYRHRTVEFRQHSATTDGTKVNNWVIFCLKMVDKALSGTFDSSSYTSAPRNNARVGTRNHRIGEMILRPQGVTAQEIMAETGWSSVSVRTHARMCGIAVTEQRTGRIRRFFAVRALQIAPTIASFAALIGLSDSEREYMQTRTTNLSQLNQLRADVAA